MKINYPLLLLIYLLCNGIPVFSQDDYLIYNNGDTLHGKIDIHTTGNYSAEEIVIRTSKKKTLNSNEFTSFVKDGTTYQVINYNDRNRIMKLVYSSPKLSWFTYRWESTYDFGTDFLYKGANQGKELSALGYRRTIIRFLSDCPGIATADDHLFKRSNLKQLVDYYNNCGVTPPAKNETTAEPANTAQPNNPALSILEALKAKLTPENSTADLRALANDITEKVKHHEKVPAYMVTVLKEQTMGKDFIQKEVQALLVFLEDK